MGCEIGFWMLVLAGLLARYLLHMKRLSNFLLISTPLVDLILLLVTAADLAKGGTASFAHGLAAIYIGVTVAYGHQMIKWADERFASRLKGQNGRHSTAKQGREHAKRERQGWYRHLLAWAIGSALILFMVYFINDDERTKNLWAILRVWPMILGVDFLISFSYTMWPREKRN